MLIISFNPFEMQKDLRVRICRQARLIGCAFPTSSAVAVSPELMSSVCGHTLGALGERGGVPLCERPLQGFTEREPPQPLSRARGRLTAERALSRVRFAQRVCLLELGVQGDRSSFCRPTFSPEGLAGLGPGRDPVLAPSSARLFGARSSRPGGRLMSPKRGSSDRSFLPRPCPLHSFRPHLPSVEAVGGQCAPVQYLLAVPLHLCPAALIPYLRDSVHLSLPVTWPRLTPFFSGDPPLRACSQTASSTTPVWFPSSWRCSLPGLVPCHFVL